MIAFILLVGVMNIAVGFVFAMLLVPPAPLAAEHGPTPTEHAAEPKKSRFKLPKFSALLAPLIAVLKRLGSLLSFLRRKKEHAAEHVTTEPASTEEHPPEVAPTPETSEPLVDGKPSPWKKLCTDDVQTLRTDAVRYRELLLTCESRARQIIAADDRTGCELLLKDLGRVNADWRKTVGDASAALKNRREPSERLETLRQSLHEALELQNSQLEAATASLEAIDLKADPAPAKRTLNELTRLIDVNHAFRDRLGEVEAILARFENKLGELPNYLQIDPATSLLSRLGFERTLVEWRTDNPRAKNCALVMFDVDRFAKLNERLGTRAGDRLLSAIGHEFSRFVNHERGLDRVCRIAGERFLFLLGDINAEQATNAAEQLRQSVEALTIECDGNTVEFTVSCSVIESHADEVSEQALARLMGALNEARKAGRNRTAVDDGKGPQVVTDPQRFPVKAKTVTAPDA